MYFLAFSRYDYLVLKFIHIEAILNFNKKPKIVQGGLFGRQRQSQSAQLLDFLKLPPALSNNALRNTTTKLKLKRLHFLNPD